MTFEKTVPSLTLSTPSLREHYSITLLCYNTACYPIIGRGDFCLVHLTWIGKVSLLFHDAIDAIALEGSATQRVIIIDGLEC